MTDHSTKYQPVPVGDVLELEVVARHVDGARVEILVEYDVPVGRVALLDQLPNVAAPHVPAVKVAEVSQGGKPREDKLGAVPRQLRASLTVLGQHMELFQAGQRIHGQHLFQVLSS